VPLVTGLRDVLSIYIQRLGTDLGVAARIARASHWGLFNEPGRQLLKAWREKEAVFLDPQVRTAFADARIGEVLDRLEKLPDSSHDEWDGSVNELALRLEVFEGHLRRLVHAAPQARLVVRRPLGPGAWSSEDWTATVHDVCATLDGLATTSDVRKQTGPIGAGLAKVRKLVSRLEDPAVLPPLTPTEEIGLAGFVGAVHESLLYAQNALDEGRTMPGGHLAFRVREASGKMRALFMDSILPVVAGAAGGAPSAASVPGQDAAGANESDLYFMRLAVDEARKSKSEAGKISPKVGVVIVKDGVVVAQAHRGEVKLGEHAEYTALEKKVPEKVLAGATVYATLEPCTTRNHPKIPCADRLIERKVAKVWMGMLDPDQRIQGEGVRRLQAARIPVQFFEHSLVEELEELNREFSRHRRALRVEGQPVAAEPVVSVGSPVPVLAPRFADHAELDETLFNALPWAPAGVAGIDPSIVSLEVGIRPAELVASLRRLQAGGRLVIQAEATSGIVVRLPRARGAEPPDVPVSAVSPRTKEKMPVLRDALTLLWRVAAPLARAGADVESISIAVVDAASHRNVKYGWVNEVYVQIKLVENPAHIPPEWRAGGHTLHYVLGAGHIAGVVALKSISKRMLGLPAEPSGEDGFLTVLDLHFLGRDL